MRDYIIGRIKTILEVVVVIETMIIGMEYMVILRILLFVDSEVIRMTRVIKIILSKILFITNAMLYTICFILVVH